MKVQTLRYVVETEDPATILCSRVDSSAARQLYLEEELD
jgi:hypothetical protein